MTLWEPGSTAFWLDPDLWLRTPEVDGKPDLCWMHLDDPVPECPFENHVNFGGAVTIWYGSLTTKPVSVVYT